MYRGDVVEDDGAVPGQHLELLLQHDVLEVEQCQLHLSHVDVQVTEGILVEGGVRAPGGAFVPRRPRRGGRGGPRGRPASSAPAAATGRTHVGELLQEVLLERARTTRKFTAARLPAGPLLDFCDQVNNWVRFLCFENLYVELYYPFLEDKCDENYDLVFF